MSGPGQEEEDGQQDPGVRRDREDDGQDPGHDQQWAPRRGPLRSNWSGPLRGRRAGPVGGWTSGQVDEQRVEVRREARPGCRSHPHLELLGIQAPLGVGLAQRADGLVALAVAADVLEFETLWQLRFFNQISETADLSANADELDITSLTEIERENLQTVLARIPVFQSKLSYDFFGRQL